MFCVVHKNMCITCTRPSRMFTLCGCCVFVCFFFFFFLTPSVCESATECEPDTSGRVYTPECRANAADYSLSRLLCIALCGGGQGRRLLSRSGGALCAAVVCLRNQSVSRSGLSTGQEIEVFPNAYFSALIASHSQFIILHVVPCERLLEYL